MTLQRLWGPASATLVVLVAGAAWAWRDCMLLALSTVLSYRLFLLHMDRRAPWRAITAAVNALSAGVLTVVAGLALIAAIAAAWLDWWRPASEHAAASLLMLSLGAAWCCASRIGRAEAAEELRFWLCLLGAAAIAVEAQRTGWALAPCLFVAAVAMAMLWAGWRLATAAASALLHAGCESH